MLDADGATKVTDLEKLENQVCFSSYFVYWVKLCKFIFLKRRRNSAIVRLHSRLSKYFTYQIHAVARKEFRLGESADSDSSFRISDIPLAAFGSRAHLEEQALATVQSD